MRKQSTSHRLMKTSSIAVETSRSTSQSDSIVRQTNKRSLPTSLLMKVNSHCWLRTALQRVQCIFIILWKYSNKLRTAAAALIRMRRLLTFRPHVRRLIEGGAYSSKYGNLQ